MVNAKRLPEGFDESDMDVWFSEKPADADFRHRADLSKLISWPEDDKTHSREIGLEDDCSFGHSGCGCRLGGPTALS